MFNKAKWLYLSVPAFIAGILGLVHHYLVTGGVWWQWSNFLHHEPLIGIAFISWFILLAVYLVEKKRQ